KTPHAHQIDNLQRAACARYRQPIEVDRKVGLVGVVLELADGAPRSDAPGMDRLSKMTTDDLARILGERQTRHRHHVGRPSTMANCDRAGIMRLTAALYDAHCPRRLLPMAAEPFRGIRGCRPSWQDHPPCTRGADGRTARRARRRAGCCRDQTTSTASRR